MLPEGRDDLAVPAAGPLGVLILHPHPDYGGDRHNHVVDACYRAAIEAGWAAIRPDFSCSDVAVARAEAAAALDLLPAHRPLAVIGYSFGGVIAGMLVDARIAAWVLVAPPLGMVGPGTSLPVGGEPRPKLLLVPEHDQYCPPTTATQATSTWDLTYVETVRGADHFLAGAAVGVAQQAITFLTP